jgi:cytochrome c1
MYEEYTARWFSKTCIFAGALATFARCLIFFLVTSALVFASVPVFASGGAVAEPPAYPWSFNGVFGKFDKKQLQRGLQVYKEVCSTCHALSKISFRNLSDLGYSEDEIKAFAGQYKVIDGPNDAGDMFERAARPSDHIPGPYANEQASRAANGGAYPPDLSLITKARHEGSDYVRALLIGYDAPPHDVKVPNGMYYNKYFAGHQIAMPAPLSDGAVDYQDDSPKTVQQYATDVAAFLTWTAETKLETRKALGLRVMTFLLSLTVLLYLYKRKVWKDVKKS